VTGSRLSSPPVAVPATRPGIDGELAVRWPAGRPFLVAGTVSIVVGGLVAAATGPAGLRHGSWTAAFLVLVGGVAQIGLGAGRAWLAARPPGPGRVLVEAVAWNIGIAATVAGTVAGAPIVTSFAALALAAALGLLAASPARRTGSRWARPGWWALAGVVALSIPVGVGLAWVRAGYF
jgi:hypothetical protein